jgi:hypothetical protein
VSPLLARLAAIGSMAWLRFVRVLNGLAASLLGAIILLNAAYPQAITQLGGDLPTPVKIGGAVLWFVLVDYALKRAKH